MVVKNTLAKRALGGGKLKGFDSLLDGPSAVIYGQASISAVARLLLDEKKNDDTLELMWSTDQNDPADHFDFTKNVPPTVANGKVYLATFSDRLNVYGLGSALAGRTAVPGVPKDPRRRGHIKGANGHTHTMRHSR